MVRTVGITFDRTVDHVDVEKKVAWIELTRAGRTDRLDLRIDDDWTDEAVFGFMQDRLIDAGSVRRFAKQSLGQDLLMVCMPPPDLQRLNRLTGLRFRVDI